MSNFAKTEDGRVAILGMQALKRIGQPADVGPVIAFRICLVTPLAVVGADAWANASVAENPARLQIAQPATPVKPRLVSMRFLPC